MLYLLIFVSLFSQPEKPPYGTVNVNGIFIDQQETQNIHWLEYIYFMRPKLDAIQYKALLPDSINNWYDHPTKRLQPIVYLSYDQVLKYCEWRSKIVSDKMNRKVVYRLPTISEWRKVANSILTTDYKLARKNLRKTLLNRQNQTNQFLTNSIYNSKGEVLNMFDNVSEMTDQNGIAVGANNSDLIDLEQNLIKTYGYDMPSFYIGFRCIAEYLD